MRTPAPPVALLATLATLATSSLLLLGCPQPAGIRAGAASQRRSGHIAYTPEGPLPGASHIDFVLPRQGSSGGASRPASPPKQLPAFYSLPWPSEILRGPDGALDWTSFPGAGRAFISGYIAAARSERMEASIATAIYFHFSGAPSRSLLPARASDTMSAASSIFLLDVDPASPERGAFIPIEGHYSSAKLRYIPAGTLAVKPLPGFVMRPGTLYAAVVRRDLGDAAGAPLGTSPDFEAIKWTSPRKDPVEERARLLHYDALNYIEELGVARADIAALALFRTGVPHAVAVQLFDVATHLPQELSPRIVRAEWQDEPSSIYRTIRGYYCTPNFQSDIDAAPFFTGGGSLSLDESGRPRVVEIPPESRYRTDECGGLLRARFFLTIPKNGPMPAGGYPLLVTEHGTGGNARSFLGDDNFAGWAARAGLAAVSTDQPLHGAGDRLGARPGSLGSLPLPFAVLPLSLFRGESMSAELAFYNPMNARATRDNLRQAGIDTSLLARVIASADFEGLFGKKKKGEKRRAAGGGLGASGAKAAPRFDLNRVIFAGHSQGSQSAAVQAAIDPIARGVLLSGCGGDARIGIVRRKDIAVMPFIEALLELAPGELSEFHPFMTLVQGLIDPVDPQSYARLYREPLPGRRPQNALHYGGIGDTYSPPEAAGALAIAMRATPLYPLALPVRGLSILGLTPEKGALRGNIGDGQATAAFVELSASYGEDGHFVLFVEPGAPELAMQFMKSAASEGGGPAEVGPMPGRMRWE